MYSHIKFGFKRFWLNVTIILKRGGQGDSVTIWV